MPETIAAALPLDTPGVRAWSPPPPGFLACPAACPAAVPPAPLRALPYPILRGMSRLR